MTIFEIRGPGPHERANCSLAGCVNAKGRSAFYARDRGRENDGAAIIKERQTLLHREQCALYIDVEQPVKMLFGDFTEGNKFTNAGVGENNIDSPLHLTDCLVETIQVGQFCDVPLNARHVAADCRDSLVEFLLAVRHDEDIGTLLDEKFCSSQPNPFCPASDDGGLAFEFVGHCLSPLLLSGNGTEASRLSTLVCRICNK